jgi:hypothetical protein
MSIVYEQTPCEVCEEPLSHGDPGSVFFVQDIVGYTFSEAWVALHDFECRLHWFKQHRVKRWTLDHRVLDVI